MTLVIDWDEAMQQCGDDEEFLRELLGDLRDETNSQMNKMNEVIGNPTDAVFIEIVRAAHVIKGAASNLMCYELRDTAMALETAASTARDTHDGKSNSTVILGVKDSFTKLTTAVRNYHEYLDSLGV
mmetsp:Transcript_23839/g.66080  ORF Transcript_23839/g.66080 Transcript_23839/m.66080 type:complete len:127 (-) Transcript_23839:559-939(-)|eukprot:CAMPEP_0172362666 /NCGR_PEP_ID=MMETSP1060-20121228/6227_1 /TAXON_ID=37318 /ORGANISM="Pseudo-nitzschia pungens, Strain cf. cingulata" /LENGTH=126 /DNA_ID=CAMNT_0013085221 /DNA_START=163 /DNA_END=543 /DNA_ORIENTATION=-